MLTQDHLTVAAETLEAGIAYVEARLGVSLEPGGRHAAMGTHNRLLGLGDGLYLEVIAIDPEASAPLHARWFDLDNFTGQPRLSNWAARCDDLSEALAVAPKGTGQPLALARGELSWEMAMPENGRLPFDGCFPALLSWNGEAHPSQMLRDVGCRLRSLELLHPQAPALRRVLEGLIDDPRIAFAEAPVPGLRARIATPAGERTLD